MGVSERLDFAGSPSLYKRLDANTTGKYCELVFISAAVAKGMEVATPVGNQRGWDVLLEIGGRWERVQVKTAYAEGGRTKVSAMRTFKSTPSGKKPAVGYSDHETDYIAAVMPEDGAIWLIPLAAFGTRTRMSLGADYLWVQGVDVPLPVRNPLMDRKEKSMAASSAQPTPNRNALRDLMSVVNRPQSVSVDAWVVAERYLAGESYALIGRDLGVSGNAVRERIERVVNRLRKGIGTPAAFSLVEPPLVTTLTQ